MDLNETKTVRFEGIDYNIIKDASGNLSVTGELIMLLVWILHMIVPLELLKLIQR